MRVIKRPCAGLRSSRSSHAFAIFQSRMTVSGDTCDHGSGLLHAETAEETQLNQPLVLPLVEFFQRFERIVEGYQIEARLDRHGQGVGECDFQRVATPFLIVLRARHIHQHATHQPRRHRQKVRAILPFDVLSVDESQVSFVYQRRRLQAVARSLTGHAAAGDAVQFPLHDRNELFERRLVAVSPRQK